MFAETRRVAADYAYRWLSAALRAERARREGASVLQALGIDADAPAPHSAEARADVVRERGEVYGGPATAPLDRAARQARALALARSGRTWQAPAYAEAFQVGLQTAARDLRLLAEQGLLRAEGRTRGRRYVWAGEAHLPAR